MADEAGPVAPQAAADQPEAVEGEAQQAPQAQFDWTQLLRTIIMMILINKGISYMFSPSAPEKMTPEGNPWAYKNEVEANEVFTLQVFLSNSSKPDSGVMVWQEDNIVYDWLEENSRAKNVTIPYNEMQNQMWIHAKLDSKENFLISSQEIISKHALFDEATYNLISGESELPKEVEEGEKIPHLEPFHDLLFLVDTYQYTEAQIPPQLKEIYVMDNVTMTYQAPFRITNFWNMRSDLVPLNDTLTEVDLRLTLSTLGIYKYTMYHQFEKSPEEQDTWGLGLNNQGEMNNIKYMLRETNLYLLIATGIVSVLHMVFEMMAMKSDIEFWKGREDLKGLSTKILLFNFCASVIIFFYLLDQQENTTIAILLPLGLGMALEFWKLTKGFDISVKPNFPFISIKGKEAHKAAQTDLFDNQATYYLSWVLIPLSIVYAGYSLMYESYKSWYSFVVGTLAGFIYTTGFLMMTPQLYINYKMKSVEHMPWKVLTYRFFNTIIDDLFSFILPMPTMHRIACFRDDVIFILYIIQRFKYRVDPNRHYMDQTAPTDQTHEKVD